MGRKTLAVATKKRKIHNEAEARMRNAIIEYQKYLNLPNAPKTSIKEIALHNRLSPSTLGRRLKGGRSLSNFNADKRHLSVASKSATLGFHAFWNVTMT